MVLHFTQLKVWLMVRKTQDKATTTIAKNVGRSNETTPEGQAELQAQAKFQKKLDSGYALNEIDAQKKKFYEPMLAHNFQRSSR